jgi:hypothetical protein
MQLQPYEPQSYNAHDHLLTWTAYNKKTGKSEVVQYYPANWRLYELRLRYPSAKFEIDLVLIDQERDFCIVRARLWVGPDYEVADIRAVAHKQGPLSDLDRVETKAKARAARDLGISTELALDMDDSPAGEVVGTIVESQAEQSLPSRPDIDPDAPATLQQLDTIKKLQRASGQPEMDLDGITWADAATMLRELQRRRA